MSSLCCRSGRSEMVMVRSLPGLMAGTAPRVPLDLKAGSYFGRRRPEDGRIDWQQSAQAIHNLVRAVAPPYPGAFSTAAGHALKLLRSHYAGEAARHPQPQLYVDGGRCYADCGDGKRIEILKLEFDGNVMDAAEFISHHGTAPLSLGDHA